MKRPAPSDLRPDPREHSPLYVQLARKLDEAVRSGRYRANQALPSERELSESLGVSRVTARKAIERLVGQGLVVRRHGSGNYIAPRIEQPLSRLTSFSEELRRRGHAPGTQWLSREIAPATSQEQLALGLSAGAKVARLERLRLADGIVVAHEVSTLPEVVVPDPREIGTSLYDYLLRAGRAPGRALQHLRAANASPVLAGQLGVAPGQAVLHITRVGYLDSGQAVELTHSHFLSDYYDFVAELRRE